MTYHRLYTLGYSGWSLQRITAALARYDAVLVDVRLNPWSRFRKEMRRASLEQSLGARYAHIKDLGNVNYRGGGPVKLHHAERGLISLAKCLQEDNVVILCGCRDLQTCHRLVVAELAAERLGVEVVHLERPE